MSALARAIATLGGLGHLRPASGTWASLAAVLAGLVILRFAGFPAFAALTVAAVGWGLWACEMHGQRNPAADPPEVVIDELAGQWIALMFPAAAFALRGWDDWLPWPAPLAAFLFFRLFDIWKPGPIGRADRRGDAAGVMLDDILAGLAAGIATLAAAALAHAVMR